MFEMLEVFAEGVRTGVAWTRWCPGKKHRERVVICFDGLGQQVEELYDRHGGKLWGKEEALGAWSASVVTIDVC